MSKTQLMTFYFKSIKKISLSQKMNLCALNFIDKCLTSLHLQLEPFNYERRELSYTPNIYIYIYKYMFSLSNYIIQRIYIYYNLYIIDILDIYYIRDIIRINLVLRYIDCYKYRF